MLKSRRTHFQNEEIRIFTTVYFIFSLFLTLTFAPTDFNTLSTALTTQHILALISSWDITLMRVLHHWLARRAQPWQIVMTLRPQLGCIKFFPVLQPSLTQLSGCKAFLHLSFLDYPRAQIYTAC